MTEGKMVPVHGWDLHVGQDAEPRVRDLDLGARLGYDRPRKFRELVARMRRDGVFSEKECRPVVGRYEVGNQGGSKEVVEYHLDQTGALLAIMRSDTEAARAITRQVVDVFLAYRDGTLKPTVQGDARIGDGMLHRMTAKGHCRAAAKAIGVSLLRVYGVLRREFKVPSMYLIRLGEWDRFLGTLELLKRECRLKSGRVPLRLRDNQGELDFETEERAKLAS